jgi:CRP-like cAMP-binding protein
LFTPTRSDRQRGQWDIPLFADCNAREIRRIDSLTTTLTIEAGRSLCRQGELGRQCFVIVDGEAEVETHDGVETVGRGALVGELALLVPNGRCGANVVAVTDLTVLVLSRTEFTQLMNSLPNVAHKILREATRRLIANSGVAS